MLTGHADLAFPDLDTDIDLTLYDSSGTPITVAAHPADHESAEMTVAAAGTYYVRANLIFGTRHTYDLRLRISCANCISYSGRLANAGAPAAGDYEFQFTLYDGTGRYGQPVGGPITRTVPVSAGLFAADLYFGETTGGTPATMLGQAHYLQIRVRPAGSGDPFTTLAPRQPLMPAPVAHTLRPGALVTGTVGDSATLNVGNSGLMGDGLRVLAAVDDGVQVNAAGDDGVVVGAAGGTGIFVCSTGFETGCSQSNGNNGLEIGNAEDVGVLVTAAGGFGVYVGGVGGDGVYVGEAGGDGVYANTTHGAGEWGLNTPDKISASNVTASSMTLVAKVEEGALLEAGAVVAAVGTAPPLPGSGERLALVAAAGGSSGAGIVGVVEGRMVLAQEAPLEAGVDGGVAPAEWMLRSAPGPAQAGDYVALTIAGVAQVRVAPGLAVAEGERLTVAADGLARPLQVRTIEGMVVTEGLPTVGVALGRPDAAGLVWVLVNPQ